MLLHSVYLDRLLSADIHTSCRCHKATNVPLLSASHVSSHIGSFHMHKTTCKFFSYSQVQSNDMIYQ